MSQIRFLLLNPFDFGEVSTTLWRADDRKSRPRTELGLAPSEGGYEIVWTSDPANEDRLRQVLEALGIDYKETRQDAQWCDGGAFPE